MKSTWIEPPHLWTKQPGCVSLPRFSQSSCIMEQTTGANNPLHQVSSLPPRRYPGKMIRYVPYLMLTAVHHNVPYHVHFSLKHSALPLFLPSSLWLLTRSPRILSTIDAWSDTPSYAGHSIKKMRPHHLLSPVVLLCTFLGAQGAMSASNEADGKARNVTTVLEKCVGSRISSNGTAQLTVCLLPAQASPHCGVDLLLSSHIYVASP